MDLDDRYEAAPAGSASALHDRLEYHGDELGRAGSTLPAAPVAEAFGRLRAVPGMAEDHDRFAAGLGLDAAWVAAVQSGSLTEVGITEIAAVCESLRCSPYDPWAPALARTILPAYGPERWPRHTEPLASDRPVDMAFVGRRLDRQAAAMVTVLDQGQVRPAPPGLGPAPGPTTTVTVTRYRQHAVLALDAGGTASEVPHPRAAADHRYEYHFAFAQVSPPGPLAVPVTAQRFAAGPPGGYDADPVLAGAAAVVAGPPRPRRRPGPFHRADHRGRMVAGPRRYRRPGRHRGNLADLGRSSCALLGRPRRRPRSLRLPRAGPPAGPPRGDRPLVMAWSQP